MNVTFCGGLNIISLQGFVRGKMDQKNYNYVKLLQEDFTNSNLHCVSFNDFSGSYQVDI